MVYPMLKKTLFFLLLFSSVSISAQEVISTQGGSYTSVDVNLDFTIGEVIINTVSDGTNSLTQGFHQTDGNSCDFNNLQVISSNVSCHGVNDGGIVINPDPSGAPYVFQWSNGATTQDLQNISAGIY